LPPATTVPDRECAPLPGEAERLGIEVCTQPVEVDIVETTICTDHGYEAVFVVSVVEAGDNTTWAVNGTPPRSVDETYTYREGVTTGSIEFAAFVVWENDPDTVHTYGPVQVDQPSCGDLPVTGTNSTSITLILSLFAIIGGIILLVISGGRRRVA
jgi:hypothetical protein